MYINQRTIPDWQKNGCGIACVAMVLARAGKKCIPEDLAKEALALNGYLEGVGWRHTALARTITNHGVPAYAQEFTSPDKNTTLRTIGLQKIQKQAIAAIPSIISVCRNFKPNAQTTHLVVVVGFNQQNFIIDDPDHTHGAANIQIPIEQLAQVWRGYAIFIDSISEQ